MYRFLPKSKKLRTAMGVGASLVVVAVIAALLASTADNGTKKKVSVTPGSTPATTKAVTLVLGPVSVQNTGLPAKVTKPVQRALMHATQQYFNAAIQTPLRNGRVNPAYVQVFDPLVKGPAARKDRSALTEVATGVIRGPVKMSATPVFVDGLGDPTGKLALVATTFTSQAGASTPAGHLTIKRRTELTFAKENGQWLVTAYRVTVRRTIGAQTTTTTAHAGTGTTT